MNIPVTSNMCTTRLFRAVALLGERANFSIYHIILYLRTFNINATMFNRIGAIILLVSDMKKSMGFYNDILGMELKQVTEDWVEFSKQGTVIALHPRKKKRKLKKSRNNSILIGFNVSDLESVCRDLGKKKVKFYKRLTDETFGRHAIIEDPDGHLISLAEMTPKEEFMQSPYYHGFAPI
jgi:predicted enzyme related to lactoylglutathione lyase